MGSCSSGSDKGKKKTYIGEKFEGKKKRGGNGFCGGRWKLESSTMRSEEKKVTKRKRVL